MEGNMATYLGGGGSMGSTLGLLVAPITFWVGACRAYLSLVLLDFAGRFASRRGIAFAASCIAYHIWGISRASRYGVDEIMVLGEVLNLGSFLSFVSFCVGGDL